MKSTGIEQSNRLLDYFNRRITYLRISLTQECNFRCSYCYGSEKLSSQVTSELTGMEINRLVGVFASAGIKKVRFTGGEPLLRHDVVDIIKQTSAVSGVSSIGLTTNGFLLDKYLPSLIDAGLNHLNISLDSLKEETFRQITGVDGIDRVLQGITGAESSGAFNLVKINTVIMRGINDNEIPVFCEWALDKKIDLRFIEFMPALESGWGEQFFVSEDEIRDRTGLNLEEIQPDDHSPGPARSYSCENYPGRISFISSVSRCFCKTCNRLRLTSNGRLRGCLFHNSEIDLKARLPVNNDNDLINYIQETVSDPGFRRLPDEVSISEYKPFLRGVGG